MYGVQLPYVRASVCTLTIGPVLARHYRSADTRRCEKPALL